jgi:hypothetical protein
VRGESVEDDVMGFLDSVFGRKTPTPDQTTDDERAVARYEELLRSADPDDLERVHSEAFARLTPEQRDLMFQQLLDRASEPDERPADATPASLGNTATLVETRKPGTIKQIFTGPEGNRLAPEPDHTLYAAFAWYFLADSLAVTYWGSYDGGDIDGGASSAPDAEQGYPDSGLGPDGFDGGFGGGFGDGGGGFGGDGGGGAF